MGYSPAIFKAYDIRGVYPTEVDEDVAYRLGRAIATFLKVRTVAVGWDVRQSSLSLRDAITRGLTDQGADVVHLGLVSSDSFYYAVSRYGFDAGVAVTASHNPAQYNGFKVVRANAAPVSGDTGIRDLQRLVKDNRFPKAKRTGTVREQSHVLDDFAAAVRAYCDIAAIKPFRVVMDTGNGMGGLIAPKIFAGLPLEIIPLCFEPDGSFPNHQANPLLPENRRHWEEEVRRQHADLGIAWDADTDRVFFLDEKVRFIPGDYVTALLAGATLDRCGGGAVVYDLRASHGVPDEVRKHGGTPHICRVGHSFIKELMRKLHAVFAGEVTGHYYYQFADSYLDNGWIPALQLLAMLSRSGGKMSELFAPLYARYHISGEHNFTVHDKAAMLQRLEEHYRPVTKRVDHLDGLTIEAKDFWFNVRPSNTEPLLRLNMEADSQSLLAKVQHELTELIEAGSK
ncbi:MAG: phosphomannomutase/phosphoglucomutase [Patescibacteria group bacterium]|nr:phosphomannomutase/phosphoglucomutase [Patescibacteria group bacterium]